MPTHFGPASRRLDAGGMAYMTKPLPAHPQVFALDILYKLSFFPLMS